MDHKEQTNTLCGPGRSRANHAGDDVQHLVASRTARDALYLALSRLVRDGVVALGLGLEMSDCAGGGNCGLWGYQMTRYRATT